MKIVRFLYKGREHYGILKGKAIRPLKGSIFGKLISAGKKVDTQKVKLLCPVLPGKIVCAGLNYKDHAKELNMPLPDEPVIFLKPNTAVIGPGDKIRYPAGIGRLDYEAELAIVIKKKCRDVSESQAGRVILGYTCLNDVTARDLQKKDGQWTRAKSFDTFCPIGPCISTDLDPRDASVELLLNGKRRQSASTKNFAFSVNKLVSFVSSVMTLNPGDVIATGTPPGVGPMKAGDTVEVRIKGIGSLVNAVSS
ncbi:MAG: fumarylacetoacetate hydrolase family protein [Candidatus Omnitrophota bacterium]